MRDLLTVLIACSLILFTASAAGAQQPEGEAISWLVTGDSYSSGEGVAGNSGECAQSSDAYGPTAARLFDGAPVSQISFTACTGLQATDYFGQGNDGKSMWDWSQELAPGVVYDVITMTFGGNDIGFSNIIKDCMSLVPSSWGDVRGSLTDDCDVTEETLKQEIDDLISNTSRIQTHTTDASQTGSIVDFYRAVADAQLTVHGQLYVLGYPKLFAPSGEWGLFQGTRCNGITRGDANMLGRISDYLDDRLRTAVEQADAGEGRITYISTTGLFTHHELCGNGEDWINGSITFERDVTKAGFHPKALGHAAEAEYLLNWVESEASGILTRRSDFAEIAPRIWEYEELVGHEFENPFPYYQQGYYAMGFREDWGQLASLGDVSSSGEGLGLNLRYDVAQDGVRGDQLLMSAHIAFYTGDIIPSGWVLFEEETPGRWQVVHWVDSDDVTAVLNQSIPRFAAATEDAAVVLGLEVRQIELAPGSMTITATATAYDYFQDYAEIASVEVICRSAGTLACSDDPQSLITPVSYNSNVSINGIGSVKAGMTVAQAEAVTGQELRIAGYEDFEGWCYFADIESLDGLSFQVFGAPPQDPEDGVISGIYISSNQFSTPSGIRIGTSRTDLLDQLGDQLVESPHAYTDGTYLDFQPNDLDEQHLSIRFEVNNGTVTQMISGLTSATYAIEGCA